MQLALGRRTVATAFWSSTLVLFALPAGAGESNGETGPTDLTPLNFGEGWSTPWVHRHRSTPDMALLRVLTNFLEQEFRLDYVFTEPQNNPKLTAIDQVNGLVAYALNRRLMLEVVGNYQWNEVPRAAPPNGPGAAGVLRLQLFDTAGSSLDLQFRASAPNRSVGQGTTDLAVAAGGWQDLGAVGARLGLYYSLQWDTLEGTHASGTRSNFLTYAGALALTWTSPETPVVGNLTTFVEAAAVTDLDGNSPGATAVGLTPGLRFWFLPKNSLLAGADIPLNHNAASAYVLRATYILNF